MKVSGAVTKDVITVTPLAGEVDQRADAELLEKHVAAVPG